jgi:hypothetical protein
MPRKSTQKTNTFSAISEESLTGQSGQSFETGSSFTYLGADVTVNIKDNDRRMAGDSGRNERGNDRQKGNIETENGTIKAGNMYAEKIHVLQTSDGSYYFLVEIEGTRLSNDEANDDLFTFYGSTPPAGTTLTAVFDFNVRCGLHYNSLGAGDIATSTPILAADDQIDVTQDSDGGIVLANILDNDTSAQTLVVSALNGDTLVVGAFVDLDDGGRVLVAADGSVQFDADGDFDALAMGETRTITMTYTITDGTGQTSDADVAITITGRNDAPVASTTTVTDTGTTGTQNETSAYTQDIGALFSDVDTGDTLTFAATGLPSGFVLSAAGVLSQIDPTSDVGAGDHVIAITATDSIGASTTVILTLTIALQHDFGRALGVDVIKTVVGSSLSDTIIVGDGAGQNGGVIIDSGNGDDVIEFGDSASNITLNTGTGADHVTFGDGAANVTIDLGDDSQIDSLTFQGSAQNITIQNWDASTGDAITFLTFANWTGEVVGGNTVFTSSDGQSITLEGVVDAGIDAATFFTLPDPLLANTDGDDTLVWTRADGNGFIDGGAGLDELVLDLGDVPTSAVDVTANAKGQMVVTGPDFELVVDNIEELTFLGSDTTSVITLADLSTTDLIQNTIRMHAGIGDDVFDASANIHRTIITDNGGNNDFRTGSGNDEIDMSAGNIADTNVDTGEGDDTIIFGANAGVGGAVSVNGGTGGDAISFGDGAENLTIDMGANDAAADTLTFAGSARNVVISNWTAGDDAIIFNNPGASIWGAIDVGADKAFTSDDGQSFTVAGAAGLQGADIVGNLTYNSAPTFIGASSALPDSVVGEPLGIFSPLTAAFSHDLNALFADADMGDSVTLSIADLPDGYTFTGGILSGARVPGVAGDYTFAVTATDQSGAQVTQNLTLAVALQSGFLDFFAANNGVEVINGSSLSDTMNFGSESAGNYGSLTVNAGEGDNTITMGQQAGQFGGFVEIQSGAGIDSIAIGALAGYNVGTVNLDTGAGADDIFFDHRAAYLAGNVSVSTGAGADTITALSGAAEFTGSFTLDSGADNDTITFGYAAAKRKGEVNVDSGMGDDVLEFDSRAAEDYGVISLVTGQGNDTVTFGQLAAIYNGTISVDLGDGADAITFGDKAGSDRGVVDVVGGGGGDTITFGASAGLFGTVNVFGDAGDDLINFGALGGASGTINVHGGEGADTINLGRSAGYNGGAVIVDGGAGNDLMTFGGAAAYLNGSVTARGGLGDDTIIFGEEAALVILSVTNTFVTVEGGMGADHFTFGDDAGLSTNFYAGSITIDMGIDTDADTLVFLGSVDNTTILNWDYGTDLAVDVVDPSAWVISDNGTNTTLINGTDELVFAGVTGLTDVGDFLM